SCQVTARPLPAASTGRSGCGTSANDAPEPGGGSRRSLLLLRLDLLEAEEVVLLQAIDLLLLDLAEAGLDDLLLDDVLAGPDVIEYPLAALVGDAVEVDDD